MTSSTACLMALTSSECLHALNLILTIILCWGWSVFNVSGYE
uniref:Uncharacterized protein n=1 Tax=Amphimedon queenslandica TaxID=400682 RepID=A0A1X7VUT4_AMPQE